MNTSKIGFDSILKQGVGKSVSFHEMMQNDFLICWNIAQSLVYNNDFAFACWYNAFCLEIFVALMPHWRKAMVTAVHYHRGRHERKHKNTYLFPLSEMVSTLTLRPIRGGNNGVRLIHKMRVRFRDSYLMETDSIVRFSIFLTALDIIHERSLCFYLNTKKNTCQKLE